MPACVRYITMHSSCICNAEYVWVTGMRSMLIIMVIVIISPPKLFLLNSHMPGHMYVSLMLFMNANVCSRFIHVHLCAFALVSLLSILRAYGTFHFSVQFVRSVNVKVFYERCLFDVRVLASAHLCLCVTKNPSYFFSRLRLYSGLRRFVAPINKPL